MFNFLHTFNPTPILISFGPINVFWYGIFIVSGILAAIFVILKITDYHKIDKNIIIDSAFYLIIGGIIGARIFHVLLEFPYYWKNPLTIFMLWQGGLAIHGAILTGLVIIWYLAKKNNINFWLLTSIYVPGIAIGQAFGRCGNYFNQELFGKPTGLPWGIPIEPANRILDYYNYQYFHPTFLYESLGNVIIFLILIFMHYLIIKNKKLNFKFSAFEIKPVHIVFSYLIMYSILRFSLEFIRIDTTPELWGLRLPQYTSLIIIIFSIVFLYYKKRAKVLEKNTTL